MEQYPRKNRYKAGPGRPKTVDPNEYYRYNANFPIELYEHLKASAFNASTPDHHVSVQEYLNNLIYTDMIQNGTATPKKSKSKPKKKKKQVKTEEPEPEETVSEEVSSEEPDPEPAAEPIEPLETGEEPDPWMEEAAWMEKQASQSDESGGGGPDAY